jgi:hypothetical protein
MKTNDMTMMRSIGRRRLVCCFLSVLWGTHGFSALVGAPETWDGGTVAGWINYDAVNEKPVTLLPENGGLKITFRSQSVKTPPEEYIIEAGTNASQGWFAGNYASSGVTGLSFRIVCDRQVEISALLYNNESKRLWRYRVPDVRTGEWMTVQVPLTPSGMGAGSGGAEWGEFEQDLQNVAWVGVSIERNSSMNLQVYRLDDFVLQGIPEFGAWMAQFPHPAGYGAGGCVGLPEGDLDGDGMCNYDEWIAGTSAGDMTNTFRLRIDRAPTEGAGASPGTGLVIKWPSAPNRKYCIWRSTNLAEGFVKLGGDEIEATPPENTLVDAAVISGEAYYYKAEVRRVDP